MSQSKSLAPKIHPRSESFLKILGISLVSTLFTPVGLANVIGTDAQNFNPTYSGLDFVTVHSSETLDPGYFSFGLFINQATNTLPHFEGSDGSRTKFNDSVLGGDINIGFGLLKNWDLGISIPQIIDQKIESDGFRGQFGQNGNTEIRVSSKVRLWGTRSYGIGLVGSANINRIKNNPYAGKDAGPTWNMELVADTTVANVALGANVGYRWRKPGEKIDDGSPIQPLGDQLIASAAASYLFSSIDTKVIFEVFGSQPAKKGAENSDRLESSAEAILGIKHDITHSWAAHFGAGSELIHGRSSPDWRLYAGINYAVGPKYQKPAQPAKVTKTEKDPFKGPAKPFERIVIHDVLFEFDSDQVVLKGAHNTLSKLVDYLNKPPVYKKLIIEGHTDSIGTAQYNKDLSIRRATTIRKWLIDKHNLDPKKVTSRGMGESKPIADNGNYQGRQLNRRVEFTIYRNTK